MSTPLRTWLAVPAAATLALALASPSVAWATGDDAEDKDKNGSSSQRADSKGDASKVDPAGNNGTVKIDGVPLDDGRGNEPHVECAFALKFYGFDDDQTADITFTGKPPTGPEGVLLSQRAVAISDDAAGGGQDRDAVISYTAAQLGLTGTAPHQNGWHVKVAVDVLEAPGGAKQKVFWLDCDQPGASAPQGGPTTTGTTSGTSPVTTTGTSTGTSTGTAVSGRAARAGTGETAVAGAFAEVAPAGAAANVSAHGAGAVVSGRSGALAATGGEIATLVLLGLAAVGIGTAGVVAGRKRRVASF